MSSVNEETPLSVLEAVEPCWRVGGHGRAFASAGSQHPAAESFDIVVPGLADLDASEPDLDRPARRWGNERDGEPVVVFPLSGLEVGDAEKLRAVVEQGLVLRLAVRLPSLVISRPRHHGTRGRTLMPNRHWRASWWPLALSEELLNDSHTRDLKGLCANALANRAVEVPA